MDTVNVGIIGFGTIGTGVVKIIQKDAQLLARKIGRPLVLKRVADIHFVEKEGVDHHAFLVTDNGDDVVSDPDIDIVIELIGGVQPARGFIEKAILCGKHVVTANKELMAKHGRELLSMARQHNVNLFFEASTGGGIPIISALTTALAANEFSRVSGILNGTTNFILTRMYNDGADYQETLEEAQKRGYAEADPSSDVEGHDIAYKLSILASIAFDTFVNVDDIYREGLSSVSQRDMEIAKEYGYVIKMLATGVNHSGQLELRVHPVMIPLSHPLAAVSGSFNAVFISGENVDEAMFYGRGAGELPTASAVMGDVLAIAREYGTGGTSASLNIGMSNLKIMKMNEIQSMYYLRFLVDDKPGVLAEISRICGENGVSIRLVKQEDLKNNASELNIMTHIVKEADLQNALGHIRELASVVEVSSLLRMEG